MSHGKSGGGKGPGGKPLKLGGKPSSSTKTKKPLNLDFSDVPKRNSLKKEATAPNARPNQRLGEFVIERISHDGRGLSQWNGKTLFVEGALPGERVSARFISEHGRYAEAVVDKVLSATAERQLPPCPHYALCGGCQLQHMPETLQLQLKQDALLEQLQRWAGLTPKHVLPVITSPAIGYRSRARLGVWYEGEGSVTVGFRQRQSKELVDVDSCLVLAPALNVLLAPLKHWLGQLQASKAVTHIELIDSAGGAGIIIRHTKRLSEADRAALTQLAQTQACHVWLQGDKGGGLADLAGLACDPRLNYELSASHDNSHPLPMKLDYHPQDFIQVNPAVNRLMVDQALKLLALKGTERVLDLFCGVGNFTLPLARRCAEVIGVEAVESMVERGRENAVLAGLDNVSFMAGDLTKLSVSQLQQRCGKVDAVLLDPPRDGAQAILGSIKQLAAKRIVYVSCNPATLARDAKVLAAGGYTLDSLGLLDMFPHTVHVESMALFVRR